MTLHNGYFLIQVAANHVPDAGDGTLLVSPKMFTHFSQPQCLFHIAVIQEFLLCVDILEDGIDNDTEN